MNTLTLPAIVRTAPAPRRQPATPVAAAPRLGWIERLATWADRQPYHRRLGSWTRV